ncbi:ribosomal-processing cysteine protease Prp [Fervidibacillus halotolerans]|uniref:Ribosomal processing cysteine protease Prp n=1 Tax=Fervidibacillus halotolerans TaxID=2980027 RepID=A0A9E8LXJ9_9BACI|nr:ribosomal-processing cysteine protease Prp [Fervidibacillus halotolerans]WAA11578.1 ribosomal-processing cysteine protease Prp [Fervidibacillus halotolerans]
MITVTVRQKNDKDFASFTVEGHANFAEKGSDIVCAGVSAVTFGAVNAVEALTGTLLNITQGGDGGYLHCEVPKSLPKQTEEKVQLLLKGMLVALQTIERNYSDYIQITFK